MNLLGPIALGLVGVVLIIVGVVWWLSIPAYKEPIPGNSGAGVSIGTPGTTVKGGSGGVVEVNGGETATRIGIEGGGGVGKP